MKGYAFKEGKISLVEKDDRAIGFIELANGGEKADIDIPVNQASWFNPENARMVLDVFDYASSVPRPMRIVSFGVWLRDDAWHFTSWEEVDDATKLLNFMFDKAEKQNHGEEVDDADASKVLNFMFNEAEKQSHDN